MAAICVAAVISLLSAYTAVGAPSAKFKLSSNKDEVYKENSFIVTVSAEDLNIAGIFAEVVYDSSSFQLQKYTVVNDEFSKCSIGSKNGKVMLVWDSNENVSFPSGDLLKLQFKTISDENEGQKEVTLDIIEICDEEFNTVASTVNGVKINLKKHTVTAAVQTTIELINNIGTVDASDECLQRITQALNSFSNLTSVEKGLVTNYSTLVEAQKRYNELKEKEEAEKNQQALDNEIKQFLQDHAVAIALTEQTAKIGDLAKVSDALNEYNTKSAYVRNKLKEEYENLKKVKSKINQLIDDEDAKRAATELAAGYKQTYKSLIELPVSNVVYEPDLKAEIESAINTYDEVFDKYAKALLTKEYEHIKLLYERYKELEIENAPEPESVVREYTEFRSKYLSLIMTSEDSVSQNDYSLIQQAMSDYDNMSDMAKGKMASTYRHLMNLLFALNNSEIEDYGYDDEPSTIVETETVEKEILKEVVKYKTIAGGNIGISTSFKVGNTVWMLLVLLGVSLVLFSIPTTLYFVMKKKYSEGGESDEANFM